MSSVRYRWSRYLIFAALAAACAGSAGPGAATPSDEPRPRCGDGRCDTGETTASCARDCLGIDWVELAGSTFAMGSESGPAAERPVHQVTVETFSIMRREATTAEYRACVDAGACTEPRMNADPELTPPQYCTWLSEDRSDHPINCITWDQARAFCGWIGGRLPTEAEWEYAARGRGQDIPYPWGATRPTCVYAVMGVEPHYIGCREERTWPVCSKPAGNTADGLCDMAGSVIEWVEDEAHETYEGAPSDGRAWVETPEPAARIARGGSLATRDPRYLRTTVRFDLDPAQPRYVLGVRCARD